MLPVSLVTHVIHQLGRSFGNLELVVSWDPLQSSNLLHDWPSGRVLSPASSLTFSDLGVLQSLNCDVLVALDGVENLVVRVHFLDISRTTAN